MKRFGFFAALACMTLAVSCGDKTDEALAAIQEYYESSYRTELPLTERFRIYDTYESDFDVWTRSQDSGEPENVKVVKRSDMKNAYDVSFTQWDYETTLTIITTGSTGDWKIDNIIYLDDTTEPLFDYSKPVMICYDITAYPLNNLLSDFVWEVNMDGEKKQMIFKCNEESNDFTGTFAGHEARGTIKLDSEGDMYAEFDEFVGGDLVNNYTISPVLTEDYDLFYALFANGNVYRMENVKAQLD